MSTTICISGLSLKYAEESGGGGGEVFLGGVGGGGGDMYYRQDISRPKLPCLVKIEVP